MELSTILEVLRKRFTPSDGGSMRELDMRILNALDNHVSRQRYDRSEIDSLRAAIVARFVADNSQEGCR